MEKEKFNSLINEINKIARLNILQYKIEKIVEEYDEFIEDFYFIEWLRLSTNNYTEKEELNNTLELFEELLEEIEIAIFNDKYELGFGNEETTGKKYIEYIEEMLSEDSETNENKK